MLSSSLVTGMGMSVSIVIGAGKMMNCTACWADKIQSWTTDESREVDVPQIHFLNLWINVKKNTVYYSS